MTTQWEYMVRRDFAGLSLAYLETALDLVGKDGWELAAIDPESSRYIFKRPLLEKGIQEALKEYKEEQ